MSLFLKIFLWFWLAMALVGGALVLAVVTTQEKSVLARWHETIGGAHLLHAQAAVELYERDGREGLAAYLARAERAAHIRAYVFEEGGREVLGGAAPESVRALAARAAGLREGRSVWDFSRAGALGAHLIASASGRRYVVVGEMSRAQFGLFVGDPRAQALRLLAVALTAGLVCYALARYLTAPVSRMRAATRRLAEGDLSARVGEKRLKRRDELADLARDFDVMAERIETLVGAQQRLLGDISHELRSPLARLSVALELAREKAGPGAESEHERIGREAARLNDLIGQLLMLARMEDGAAEQEAGVIDLADILRETAADADFEARASHRFVHIVASESCPVRGSRVALRSALENVLRNAVRYTAEGSAVECALRREGGGGRGGARAVLAVRDHGAGVPEEALGELFRPFYRVDDARERRTGGVGLGLAITERAVRLHGGEARAFNATGGGLVVELSLPVGEA